MHIGEIYIDPEFFDLAMLSFPGPLVARSAYKKGRAKRKRQILKALAMKGGIK